MKIISIAVLILTSVTLIGCSSETSNYSSYESDSGYEGDYYDYESVNPYSEDSGHGAGWEWAERTGGDCSGGKSSSFIEGCEEYYSSSEYYE